jgi:hypothetical protein
MCSNPVYQNTDDETVLKMSEQDILTSEQAEMHLTKMLNKEDDQTPKPDYEIVDTVTDETKRTDPTPHYIDLKYLVPTSLILFRRLYSDRLDCYTLRHRIPMLSAHYYRNPMLFHVLLPRSWSFL